jgi:2-phosphosulfolactate phosphatase
MTEQKKGRQIEVCLSPALLPYYHFNESIVVVIDIFRATSSICYGFDNGAKQIIPVASVEECKQYKHNGNLFAAERNGEVVEGFDFGNSPFSYTREKVEGKTIVLTTTNGTHAIQQVKDSHRVIIGSFLNKNAVCNWLKEQDQNVLLLCAGWKNKFNLEDTLFAGAVINQLKDEFVQTFSLFYINRLIASE